MVAKHAFLSTAMQFYGDAMMIEPQDLVDVQATRAFPDSTLQVRYPKDDGSTIKSDERDAMQYMSVVGFEMRVLLASEDTCDPAELSALFVSNNWAQVLQMDDASVHYSFDAVLFLRAAAEAFFQDSDEFLQVRVSSLRRRYLLGGRGYTLGGIQIQL